MGSLTGNSPSPKRAEWGNHCEYFLTSLGLAVGLGNLWRFPYVAYSHGGGTFLVPYFIMLIVVAIPLFFMELVLGQYAGLSAIKIYSRLAPGLKGLGYGMSMIPTVVNFYYVVIMAYALLFLFYGFTSKLPWTDCTNDWNSANCFSLTEQFQCSSFIAGYNTYCLDSDNKPLSLGDVTKRMYPSEEFWNTKILGMTIVGNHTDNRWDQWGSVNWPLVGTLGLSYALIFLCMIKGIQSYGKLVYFITLFPYVVLTIFLGYVATLDGFVDGILFYLKPDWSRLTGLEIWNKAAVQVFYSLSLAGGSQLILSSYNDFRTNAFRNSILIAVFNSATSIYAGFVVFGTIGFVAKTRNTDIENVINAGPGLTFVVYPEAMAAMEACPPLFSFLFFFMLCLLALSSICGSLEVIIGSIYDLYPSLAKRPKWQLVAVTCLVSFLGGIPICFDSGFLLFQIMDDRTGKAIILIAFIEVAYLSWCYGTKRFFENIKEMGMKLPRIIKLYLGLCWNFITPLILLTVSLDSWINYKPDGYMDYEFETAVQCFGWVLELSPLGVVAIIGLIQVFRRYKAGKGIAFVKTGPMLQPKDNWGPRPDRDIDLQDHVLDEKIEGVQNMAFE